MAHARLMANPFPKELYIVKDGHNELGLEWETKPTPSTLSSYSYTFDENGFFVMRVRVGNHMKYSFKMTSTSPITNDITKYSKLHITYTHKHGGNAYRNVFLFVGDKRFQLDNTSSVSQETTATFTLEGLTGSPTFSIDYHDHDGESGAWKTGNFTVKDIWLSWDVAPYSVFSSITKTSPSDRPITFSLERLSEDYMHEINFYDGDDLIHSEFGKFDGVNSITLGNHITNSHPTETSFPVTVELITYAVDEEGNREELGSPDPLIIIIEVPTSIKPKIYSYDFGPTPEIYFDDFIQGYTKVNAKILAGRYIGMWKGNDVFGPPIAEYSVTIEGKTYTSPTSPVITDVISSYGWLPITIKVKDQRGRTDSMVLSLEVFSYSKPTLSVAECFRSDAAGNADDDSHYLKVRVSPIFSSIGGHNKVTLSATVSGTTYQIDPSGSIIGGTLSPDSSYVVTFSVTDMLGNTTTATVKVPTRVWAMQFMPNGMGVAFGKAATEGNALQVPEDWKIQIGDTALTLAELNRLINLPECVSVNGGTIHGSLVVEDDLSADQFTAEGVSTKQLSIDKANIIPQQTEEPVNLTLPAVSGELALKGGPALKKVWENSAPTANFAAQSVELSETSEWYLIKVKTATTLNGYSYTVVQSDVLSACYVSYHGASRNRAVTITGATATFETGYSGSTGGTSHAIPVEIYTINW